MRFDLQLFLEVPRLQSRLLTGLSINSIRFFLFIRKVQSVYFEQNYKIKNKGRDTLRIYLFIFSF